MTFWITKYHQEINSKKKTITGKKYNVHQKHAFTYNGAHTIDETKGLNFEIATQWRTGAYIALNLAFPSKIESAFQFHLITIFHFISFDEWMKSCDKFSNCDVEFITRHTQTKQHCVSVAHSVSVSVKSTDNDL